MATLTSDTAGLYGVKAQLPTELQFDRQQDEDAVYDDEDAVATAILTRATTAIDLLEPLAPLRSPTSKLPK